MAYYAALVSVVELLKDITHHHRYPNFVLEQHQLHFSLYAKFNLLLEMLDDYSPKNHKDEANDILERRIRDAAYCAQDIIEFQISRILVADIRLEKRTSGVERVRRDLVSTFRKPLDSIAEKIYYGDFEKVEVEVDSVVDELIRIKAEKNTVHDDLQPNSSISVEESRVQAPSCKNTMLVFDENLMTKIKAQLCGESSKLEVISIAGMGGLGKTTLAKNIFDGKLVNDRFHCRAWVTVSQDYHLKTILRAIVNSLNINKEELGGDREEVLREHIHKTLFGRRYLIVMDDVWETKFWNEIRRIFPDNSNGSRILITTRLSDVANHVSGSKFHHQMQLLNENQSWTLFREKVFPAQELEVIGKKIAKNCRGLPLAIVAIAGVLANVKRAQHDWGNIARNVSSIAIDQNDDQNDKHEHLLTILSLSYNHLPHHLKPCFLYLGGFPKNHEIRISKLIRLWVAEGFLKPIESKSLEEVGEEYLRDLVNRNLVLITRKKLNGKFKFCMIHDVLIDLCLKRASDGTFLLCLLKAHYVNHIQNAVRALQRKDDAKRVHVRNVRRVCISTLSGYSKIHDFMIKHGSHVRSLINCSPVSSDYYLQDKSLSAASGGKLWRILDTHLITVISSATSEDTIYDNLAELVHLRYLNVHFFGYSSISVPSQIFHLQNLQTLIFEFHGFIIFEIWKLPQLRHVKFPKGVKFPQIPYDEVRIIDGVPLLGSLQTLSTLIDFTFTSDTIKMIPSLKKLRLICNAPIWEDYGLNNLVHLHQIETLNLSFWSSPVLISLPENFAFPSTLIKLTLYKSCIPWKDMSVVGSLPNLQVLKLRGYAFEGEEWEPIEGEFLKLKYLEMERLPELQYWKAENTHFPLLEQLHIRSCISLEEVPPGIGDIPTLQLITLKLEGLNSSALESSALKILEQQRDLGNDDLQVRVSS